MSIFTQANTRRPKKSAFNLSHEVKQSMNWAKITPMYLQEIIPGDSFKVSSEIIARMAPMLAPVMHRINVKTDYFFVPNRIVWDGWKDFITGGEDGQNNSSIPKVFLQTNNGHLFKPGTLSDYMGVPPIPDATQTAETRYYNALPFRGYQEIFNEYYRDQNLQSKVEYSHGDELPSETENGQLLTIRTRNWEKDYFTSALPWAQKGNPVTAPIEFDYLSPNTVTDGAGTPINEAGNIIVNAAGVLQESPDAGGTDGAAIIENLDPDSTGIDVNELRTAVKLQQWLERNARAGSRYVESILAHFGVRVPDYTAQRPIYLGGSKQPITVSEVLQQSATIVDGDEPHVNVPPSPQGNMAGHGISMGAHGFKGKFTEHGYVIGVMTIMPRTQYQNGLHRTFTKDNKFDIYWPEFAQLGEQPVFNSELNMDYAGSVADSQATFGYQSRYADMKYMPSRVAGNFRDNLSFWHLGRQFANTPTLSEEFIQCDPRDDIFAVTEEGLDKFYVQIYHNVKAVRPIPAVNIPTL